ncbi:hypothetical protein ABTE31_19690, partial [Acinetobacter baumannii]
MAVRRSARVEPTARLPAWASRPPALRFQALHAQQSLRAVPQPQADASRQQERDARPLAWG